MKKTNLALMALLLSAALAGCAAHADAVSEGTSSPGTKGAAAQTQSITVQSHAELKVTPDKATIDVSIENEAQSAEDARAENARLYEAVVERLDQLGIDKHSIQTSWTNLNPIWDYEAQPEAITGYAMYTRISVSDLDIADVGKIMQACVGAGATGVHGPSFYASGYDEVYQEALAKAVAASATKADALASAAGVRVTGVVEIVEGPQDSSYRYEEVATTEEDTLSDGGAPVHNFEPGELSVEATVSVSYAMS